MSSGRLLLVAFKSFQIAVNEQSFISVALIGGTNADDSAGMGLLMNNFNGAAGSCFFFLVHLK
ncbi:hypothetical protein OK016_23280 [Vibrio chagasii]|nr:hypothetical protein [Vibrio chagasii]